MPSRLIRQLSGCAVALVLALAGTAQPLPVAARAARQRAPAAEAIAYTLTFPAPERRTMRVGVVFAGLDAPLDLRMSRSSPGRYALHEFVKNVTGLSAVDGAGRPLQAVPAAVNRWTIGDHDGTVRVQYDVFGDRIDGTYLAVDETHAHVNIPAALAWAHGIEARPARVTIVPPAGAGWRVSTQLFPTTDPFTFTAPSWHYLVDSPIEASRHAFRSFTAGNVGDQAPPTIEVAVHHTGSDADVDAFADALRRIVVAAANVFGEYPAFEDGRYTFLADYVPWAVGDGMEHRNSTVLTSSASLAGSRRMLLETAAHEFFHAWNVERIRPRSLEPFDLESANASGELWFAEGVTSYYETLIMHRAKLAPLDQTVAALSAAVAEVVGSPAFAFRSAEAMSRMAPLVDGAAPRDRTNWSYTFISYYTFGEALGLGLDLAIRERTASARSLDDVMRLLWQRHGRAGGPAGTVAHPYDLRDLELALAAVTGDARFGEEFIGRYVRGRDTMDYARLCELAGLVVRPRGAGRASLGAVGLEQRGPHLALSAPPPPGSPLGEARLGEGDRILGMDGRKLDGFDTLEQTLARRRPGDRVAIEFARRGEQDHGRTTIVLIEDPRVELVTAESLGRTPSREQLAFRQTWLFE
jgi:predicted metalloprotease with PDZ domain